MIDDYAKFVDHTTSIESKDYVAFVDRLWKLESAANLPRLLTAVIGMQSETGEFAEIVKKCVSCGNVIKFKGFGVLFRVFSIV